MRFALAALATVALAALVAVGVLVIAARSDDRVDRLEDRLVAFERDRQALRQRLRAIDSELDTTREASLSALGSLTTAEQCAVELSVAIDALRRAILFANRDEALGGIAGDACAKLGG